MRQIRITMIVALACIHLHSGRAQEAQEGLFQEVLFEETVTPDHFVNAAYQEYASVLEQVDTSQLRPLARLFGRDFRVVGYSYRTTDPSGNPVTASGAIAFPLKGRWKGVVEVAPVCKEKAACITTQKIVVELIASLFGYVTIIPDMIGYGLLEHLPIDYMDVETAVRFSVDMRKAAGEYVQQHLGKRLSGKSVLFGYSLGAPNALALGKYYQEHPEKGVKVDAAICGGGAYDPVLAMDQLAHSGVMDYFVLPPLAVSTAYYKGFSPDYGQIFRGKLLDSLQPDCSGYTPALDLLDKYGTDLHAYMHPDFFTPEGNPHILQFRKALAVNNLCTGWKPRFNLILVHSQEDTVIPVACSDTLYKSLKKVPWHATWYLRSKHGSHYGCAAQTGIILAAYLLL